jgi:hypothetical protein
MSLALVSVRADQQSIWILHCLCCALSAFQTLGSYWLVAGRLELPPSQEINPSDQGEAQTSDAHAMKLLPESLQQEAATAALVAGSVLVSVLHACCNHLCADFLLASVAS